MRKKDQGAAGGNPYSGPLAARNRNRFRFQYPSSHPPSQFPAATGRTLKGLFNNGKETKKATSTTWFHVALYDATDEEFGLFIKGCILTGVRPYSELAKGTADHVVETPQGI